MDNEFVPISKIVDEEGNIIEFELMHEDDEDLNNGSLFQQDINELDRRIKKIEKKAKKLDQKIDSLNNNADSADYIVAVASGILTGLLDAFFVGKLDLKSCNEWGSDKINSFVKKVAGEDGDDEKALERAIKKLEEKTKSRFPSDSNTSEFGGGLQHHLRDFAHHTTLEGLLFSLLTQFTKKCYGTNTEGNFIVIPVNDLNRIGDTIQQKIVYGTVYWFFHLVSDMAGTSANAGKGTGIPGPFLSLAKELSVLPPFSLIKFNDDEIEISLSKLLSKIFNGTLFAEHDENGKIIKESVVKIDLRTEIGIIKAQTWPVLINEFIVRIFYSIRRLIQELKINSIKKIEDLKLLEWRKIFPFKNRTLNRMLTISTGTFMTVDFGDAAIRATKNATNIVPGCPEGTSVAFVTCFLLRINYVGIGRFAISVVSDVKMGLKKVTGKEQKQRYLVYKELLELTKAQMYYRYKDNMKRYNDLIDDAFSDDSLKAMEASIKLGKEMGVEDNLLTLNDLDNLFQK